MFKHKDITPIIPTPPHTTVVMRGVRYWCIFIMVINNVYDRYTCYEVKDYTVLTG